MDKLYTFYEQLRLNETAWLNAHDHYERTGDKSQLQKANQEFQQMIDNLAQQDTDNK